MMKLNKWLLNRNSFQKFNSLRVVDTQTAWYKPLMLMCPALIILIGFTVIPFVLVFRDSMWLQTDTNSLLPGPRQFDISTFKEVATDPLFVKGVTNSIYYALISVPLILMFSAIIASAIVSVNRKRTRSFLQTIFFLPYVTSAIAISLAFNYIFDWDTGILNKIITAAGGNAKQWLTDTNGSTALAAMIIYGVWRGLAFNILIFSTAMLSVDKNLYKAASIDGAGPTKQFFKITIPAINRTINFLIIMGIIGAVKVFPLALFNNSSDTAMTNGGSTLMLYIFHQLHSSEIAKAGVASIYLLLISVGYSLVVKGGFNQVVKFAGWIGEKRVENKIQN